MGIEDRQAEVVQELEDHLETLSPTSQDWKDLRKEVDLYTDTFSEAYEADDEDEMYEQLDQMELLVFHLRK